MLFSITEDIGLINATFMMLRIAIKWSFSVCVNFKGDQSEVCRQKGKGKSGRGKTLDDYKDRSEVRVRGEAMVVIKVAEHKTGVVASAKIILKHEYTILMVPKLNQIGFPLKTGHWFSKIPAPLKLLPASGATVTQKNCSNLFH